MERSYRYLLSYIIFTLIGLSVVAKINQTIDPANLFGKNEYVQGIVNSLISGNNVANLHNYDDRLLQRVYIQKAKRRKDILIFGSSRSLEIRANYFPGQTFFNHSVAGASLEDYAAIYELYRQQNLFPSRVILGLDPWVLNLSNRQFRWKTLEKEFYSFINHVGLKNHTHEEFSKKIPTRKLIELFSIKYFKESIRTILNKPTKYYSTSDSLPSEGGKLVDGSNVFNSKIRGRSSKKVESIAVSHTKPPYGLIDFNKLDQSSIKLIKVFLKHLRDKGIKVTFFFPPYHPTTYKLLIESEGFKIINQVESFFTELAKDNDISVLGSYDPAVSLCEKEDFFDGIHPKPSCINRIFSANLH